MLNKNRMKRKFTGKKIDTSTHLCILGNEKEYKLSEFLLYTVDMKEIVLDGLWNAEARRLDDNPSIRNGNSFPMHVPGDITKELVKASLIPDPDIGLNANTSEWLRTSQWTLSRTFTLDGMKAVYYKGPEARINGKETAGDSMISSIAEAGENSIEIDTGCLIPSGLRIYETDDTAIISLEARPKMDRERNWHIDIMFSILSAGCRTITALVDLHGQSKAEKMEAPDGISEHVISMEVESPELWHPNGYGYPHLYQLSLSVDSSEASCLVSLRDDCNIFQKGAIWSSLGPGATAYEYEYLAKGAAEANMNVIYIDRDVPGTLSDAADRYGLYIEKLPPLASVGTVEVLPSPPSMSSVLAFAPLPADLSLSSPVMEAHEEKPGSCKEVEMLTAENFPLPSTFEKGVYLSELNAALDAADKVSRLRANRSQEGIILSKFNDTRPQIAGTLVECNGKWKIPMYASRLFFAPVCPLMFIEDDTLFIYVVNDRNEDVKAELSLKFRTFAGKKKDSREYQVEAKAMSSVLVDSFPLTWIRRDEVFCYSKLSTKNLLRERNLLLTGFKESKLEDPSLKWECRKTGQRTISIKLTVDKPAFYVTLDAGNIKGLFSDNMISVRPSAEKTVIFRSDEDVDEEAFRDSLKVYDLYSAMH